MFKDLLKTYNCGRLLGKGSSAQVFEVTDRSSGVTYACKVVHKNTTINDDGTMTTEAEILKRLKHDNVVRLHELYETSSSKWYIMELAGAGTLYSALASEKVYSEELVAQTFKRVLQGVQYLHEMGVVHRDLKPDNILCTIQEVDGVRTIVPKIVDFGLSAVLNQTHASAHKMKSYRKLKQIWGTKEYFAPEVYEKAYGPQADVWSLGCVLYELLTGETPFPVREKQASVVERYLLNGGHKLKRHFELQPGWQALSAEARDLIHRMLKVNPRKRLSVAECLAHPFITGEALAPSSTSVSEVSQGSHITSSSRSSLRTSALVDARALMLKRVHSKAQQHKQIAATLDQDMRNLVARAENVRITE